MLTPSSRWLSLANACTGSDGPACGEGRPINVIVPTRAVAATASSIASIRPADSKV